MVIRAIIVFFLISPLWLTGAFAQEVPWQSQVDTIISRIKERTSLKLVYQNITDLASVKARFAPADNKDLPRLYKFLVMFEEEIQKYPDSFFKKNRISTIALVKKHFFDKKAVEGLYDTTYNRIFLDFSRNADNPLLQRHNIHHEIYHMIAFQVDRGLDHRDPSWESLNISGFMYDKNNSDKKAVNPYNRLAPAVPGFVTEYAMISPEEDKAEIFACLMLRPQHKLVARWMERDQALKRKVTVLKDFIWNFCADMDEEFWAGMLR